MEEILRGTSVSSRILLAQLTLTFACVPYLIVAALMGERDRLAAQARAGQARAERASEAKSRLLANVAHEIKSPVGGIVAPSRALGENADDVSLCVHCCQVRSFPDTKQHVPYRQNAPIPTKCRHRWGPVSRRHF